MEFRKNEAILARTHPGVPHPRPLHTGCMESAPSVLPAFPDASQMNAKEAPSFPRGLKQRDAERERWASLPHPMNQAQHSRVVILARFPQF
jgi:hypothetical protein